MSKMTPQDVANKVDWEGGLFDTAFEYGLKSDDMEDSELKTAWARMEREYAAGFGEAYEDVVRILDGMDD